MSITSILKPPCRGDVKLVLIRDVDRQQCRLSSDDFVDNGYKWNTPSKFAYRVNNSGENEGVSKHVYCPETNAQLSYMAKQMANDICLETMCGNSEESINSIGFKFFIFLNIKVLPKHSKE